MPTPLTALVDAKTHFAPAMSFSKGVLYISLILPLQWLASIGHLRFCDQDTQYFISQVVCSTAKDARVHPDDAHLLNDEKA